MAGERPTIITPIEYEGRSTPSLEVKTGDRVDTLKGASALRAYADYGTYRRPNRVLYGGSATPPDQMGSVFPSGHRVYDGPDIAIIHGVFGKVGTIDLENEQGLHLLVTQHRLEQVRHEDPIAHVYVMHHRRSDGRYIEVSQNRRLPADHDQQFWLIEQPEPVLAMPVTLLDVSPRLLVAKDQSVINDILGGWPGAIYPTIQRTKVL